jgi:MYXO-CTERM domain-containing protein
VEPYEVVVPKNIGWSPDGSLAHYTLKYKNRIRADKKGHAIIGFFVDVATGKTLASYQVEQVGFMCPKLKPLWDRSKPRAWGEALVKKIGFVPAGKKRTRPPKAGGQLKLQGVKSKVGWVAAWGLPRWFAWRWQAYKRPIDVGEKLDPWLELRYQGKGERKWRVLSKHRPYLDYHYSLKHRAAWKEAREREQDSNESNRKYCGGIAFNSAACKKKLRDRGLAPVNEYPFTGEVWIFWNDKADALLAFWDDAQLLSADTDQSFVVYRSNVSVHTLVSRQPSTLIPKDTPPPMKPAVKAPASVTSSTAAAGTAAKMGASEPADSSKKTPAQKKGCGCQSDARSAPLPLLLGLLALLALRRRRR